MFQELSLHGTIAPVERSLHKQLSRSLTFVPVELSLPYLKICGKQENNVSIGVFWQTFAAVYLSGNEFKRCHVGLYNNGLTNHRLELNVLM